MAKCEGCGMEVEKVHDACNKCENCCTCPKEESATEGGEESSE